MDGAVNIRTFPMGPFATNCYLAWRTGARSCWIIDASFKPRPLIDTVQAEGLDPTMLILTHAHVDHIAGVQDVRQAFPGIPVLLHEAEAQWLTDPQLNLSSLFGLPLTCAPADRLLAEGEELDLDGLKFKVLHTPGHSPGGICLYQSDEAIAFAGDTLFLGSIGRTDFPNADHTTLIRSIRTKLMTLPDEVRIYPGHGPDTTIGQERKNNPFL